MTPSGQKIKPLNEKVKRRTNPRYHSYSDCSALCRILTYPFPLTRGNASQSTERREPPFGARLDILYGEFARTVIIVVTPNRRSLRIRNRVTDPVRHCLYINYDNNNRKSSACQGFLRLILRKRRTIDLTKRAHLLYNTQEPLGTGLLMRLFAQPRMSPAETSSEGGQQCTQL